ncbi:MAG: ComEA family DNA-binding protein [Eubacterium sp.]|nr:ComEA family DNA-binding protein [Eubacterium sp.]
MMFTVSACSRTGVIEADEGQQTVVAQEDSAGVSTTDGTDSPDAQETIYVEIAGAVRYPGVYEMSPGDRVFEAIEAAGGFSSNAYTDDINQAQVLNDADKITVLTNKQAALEKAASDGESSGESSEDDGLIDINTADAESLTALPGIGDSKAAAIVSYREEHGPFQSSDQLMDVSGIGESTYANLKDYIKV